VTNNVGKGSYFIGNHAYEEFFMASRVLRAYLACQLPINKTLMQVDFRKEKPDNLGRLRHPGTNAVI